MIYIDREASDDNEIETPAFVLENACLTSNLRRLQNSKLGVPLERFRAALRIEPHQFINVSGIQFHANCDSEDTGQLIATIQKVESVLRDELRRFRWLNESFTDWDQGFRRKRLAVGNP